ncbi:MAG: helix-turn-helix domain-containing protein [Clostridia bacterium]
MDFKYQYYEDPLEYHHELNQHPNQDDFYFHVDSQCEIYGFLSGDGAFRVEGTRYRLSKPTILIVREGEAHCFEFFSQSPYEREVVHFNADILRQSDPEGLLMAPFYDRPLGYGNLIAADEQTAERLWYYMRAMHSTSTDPKIQRLTLISYLLPLLYEIRTIYLTHQSAAENADPQELIGRIVKYINAHLNEPLSSEMLAKKFFVSQSQINRLFNQRIGSSVYQYIQFKRLIEARLLLRSGQAPGEVYLHCGYNDYSCFYKAYKKFFGIAPGDERKQKSLF